jgi:transposase
MTGKRRRYSAEFKAKVALGALRGELTTAQPASKHGIHQTMVGEWKRQAVEGLAAVFTDRSAAQETAIVLRGRGREAAREDSQLLVEPGQDGTISDLGERSCILGIGSIRICCGTW